MSNDRQGSAPTSSDSINGASEQFPAVTKPVGSFKLVDEFPTVAATSDPSSSSAVLSKDVALNSQHHTWLRLFLPRKALDDPQSPKLPLIVYFHGGGFVKCSAATTSFHNFCIETADRIRAVVVSVEYRLAPAHRLPAAYDDAMDALDWIRTSQDEWVRAFADFSSCFLMGNSAGGNIAYHAGLRAAGAADDLLPLTIRGLVLHQPAFGGSHRTGSELRLVNDSIIPTVVVDHMWQLALPIGADRDHEYCNPMVGKESASLEQIKRLGWRVMVTDCDGDPLVDRARELAELLENKGVQVMKRFDEGGVHGVELGDSARMNAFFASLQTFLRLE